MTGWEPHGAPDRIADGLPALLRTSSAVRGANGTPEPAPYTWRPGEAEREAELAATLAAIRKQAAANNAARRRTP